MQRPCELLHLNPSLPGSDIQEKRVPLPGRAPRAGKIDRSAALILLMVIGVGSLLSPRAYAQKINLPPVTRVRLENGVRLVLMEYHRAPSLSLNALFTGGSGQDPLDKRGVAALTASLLRKGTVTRTATQIAEQIDTLGGSLDASAGDDRLQVGLSVLSKDTDTGLDLFADVIRHPTLPDEELDRERQLEISELQAIGEDPGAIADRVATTTVYGSHPYGYEPTITTLKAITSDDLRAYYGRVFVPNRLILVAVGDFKTAEMLAKLKMKFGDWPRSPEMIAPLPIVTVGPRKVVLIDKPDATQTQVRWIRTAFARNSPDYFAALVAEAITGGGFTSRLINEIRVNRSLTYSISSRFGARLAGGDFVVSTFTKIETTKALLDATTNVLRQTAARGFTPGELQKFKNFLAGQFAIQVQSPEALAAQLSDIAFYNLPADYLQTYLLRLRAVPLADANRIARAYFAPDMLSLILVAPAAKVKSQLSSLGVLEISPVGTVGK